MVTLATPIRLARLPDAAFGALFPAPGPGALDLRFFPRIRFASSSFFFFWRSDIVRRDSATIPTMKGWGVCGALTSVDNLVKRDSFLAAGHDGD